VCACLYGCARCACVCGCVPARPRSGSLGADWCICLGWCRLGAPLNQSIPTAYVPNPDRSLLSHEAGVRNLMTSLHMWGFVVQARHATCKTLGDLDWHARAYMGASAGCRGGIHQPAAGGGQKAQPAAKAGRWCGYQRRRAEARLECSCGLLTSCASFRAVVPLQVAWQESVSLHHAEHDNLGHLHPTVPYTPT
jgi:hypothetical protein